MKHTRDISVKKMMFIATPLSYLVTGIVVDNLFEPAVNEAGWAIVAPIVGDTAGSGMGLFILMNGIIIFIITLIVYLFP
jgi:MFS transporter, DHA3 family, macrolide efflux protein